METKKTFKEIINGGKPVLVDFFAEWCGPCKMMPPVLHEVKQALGDEVTIIKIDVDRNDALANQYGIQGVPTLIIFQNGEIKWRQSGVVPARQLQTALQQYL
ncbi:MAG: thioredoxin [Chitinophagaceae bacterium]|nr:MAG: thioredoxin [Chitinophagaceae bacterium]